MLYDLSGWVAMFGGRLEVEYGDLSPTAEHVGTRVGEEDSAAWPWATTSAADGEEDIFDEPGSAANAKPAVSALSADKPRENHH